jgi:hypothetical protein
MRDLRHPFHHLPLPWDLPLRTPGPLGYNDRADPNVHSPLGETPGPLGVNDHADPNMMYVLKGRGPLVRYVIPQPKSLTPPILTADDIQAAAKLFDIEAAAIYAVSEVESGGRTGFDSKGRPKILFEARWFHTFTAGKYDCSHPHLSQATWEGARTYYGKGQWNRLLEASVLDPESALKSASWGKFQVMGFNHSGFANVFDFCDGMFTSEREHLRSFLAYCKDHGLIRFLRARDWERFAKGYNGSEFKQSRYDQKLRNAYDNFRKTPGAAK